LEPARDVEDLVPACRARRWRSLYGDDDHDRHDGGGHGSKDCDTPRPSCRVLLRCARLEVAGRCHGGSEAVPGGIAGGRVRVPNARKGGTKPGVVVGAHGSRRFAIGN
jgi:hypothetical protein